MKMMKYIYACCLLMLTACSDKDPVTFPPVAMTGNVSDIYREGAVLYGSIQNQNGANIAEFGILRSDYPSMAEPVVYPVESGDCSAFNVVLRDLTPGKTYYYCAYATSGYSEVRGEVKNFNTTESNPPIFDDVHCEVSYENGFQITAHIADIGDHELLLCGFCYREADGSGKEPTIADHTVYVEDLGEQYSFPIDGLIPNKTYLVRAFAGNARGVGYSQTIEVSTEVATVPNVSEIMVDSIASSYVSVSANVWLPEGEELSEAGFCWSTESSVPTIEHNHCNVLDQKQGDKFSYKLEGLKPETVYYIRPYVVSTTHGTCYGDVCQIKTVAVVIPEVSPGDGSIDDLPTEEL